MKLDKFTEGYITAALWASLQEDGKPLDYDYDSSDLAEETLNRMIADCADFQKAQAELLVEFCKLRPRLACHTPEEAAGHDFWLTRNGHGTGFWDRGAGEVGDKLSDAAHVYGSVDLYVGDDGKIYGS